MGLRSPQELKTTAIKAEGTTRFQGTVAPKIDTTFLNTLGEAATSTEEKRLKAEKVQYDNAEVKLDNANTRVRIKAEAEMANTEGTNTVAVNEKKREEIARGTAKNLEAVPERFRHLLAPASDKAMLQYETFAVPRMYGEIKKVQKETYKEHTANKINDTIANSNNDNRLGLQLKELNDSAMASAKLAYGDTEESIPLILGAIEKAQSEAIRRSVEMQAKSGNLERAAGILAGDHADKMTEQDKTKAFAFMDAAKKANGTRDASTLAMMMVNESGGDALKAENLIMAHPSNDKMKREAIGFMKFHYANQKIQKEKNIENIKSQVHDSIRKGDDNWRELVLGLPEDDKNKIIDNANKYRTGNTITDFKLFGELTKKLHGMSPKDASAFKLDAYSGDIAPKQMEKLEALLGAKQEKGQGDKDRAQNSTSKMAAHISQVYKKQHGIMPGSSAEGVIDAAVLERWNDLKDDKNITVKEMQARINADLKQRMMKTTPGKHWWNSDVVEPSTSIAPDLSKVPEESRLELRRQVMAKYGKPISIEEENRQLERLISTGKITLLP